MHSTLTWGKRQDLLHTAILTGSLSTPSIQEFDKVECLGISWELEVEPKFKDQYPPSFSFDNIHFPVRRWTDLCGCTAHFQAPYDDFDYSQPQALTVTHEHNVVTHADLEILDRTRRLFHFRVQGICMEVTPFLIEGWAHFKEITVSGAEHDTTIR